jgi:hypothetical protein
MLTIILAAAAISASTAPDTGTQSAQRTRTPAEIEAVRTDDTGLVVVTRANGTKSVNLQGRFQMESTATVGPDGKVILLCNGQGGGDHTGHNHAQPESTVATKAEAQ